MTVPIPNVAHGLINGITPNVEWRRWFDGIDSAVAQGTATATDQSAAIATLNAEVAALQTAATPAAPKGTKPAQILARISLGF